MNLFRIAAFIAALCTAAPAFAQWQTPNHSVPMGRGVGKTGFGSVAPGAANTALFGTGSTTDPAFRQPNFTDLLGTLTAAQAAAIAPQIPVIAPSSVGAPSATGSGCNPTATTGPVLHHLLYTDQNWCTLFNLWSMSSIEPSALMSLTVGGSVTPGDVITVSFFSLRNITVTSSVTYTTQGGDTPTTIALALSNAIQANATLFTQPSGGYQAGAVFAYVIPVGPTIFADFSAQWLTTWQYTVSAASTETITSAAGWLTNTIYYGATSGGAANAQTITVPGFIGSTGGSIQFTAGLSNSAAMTLNVNGAGAINVQKYVAGALTNVVNGDVVAGTAYVFNNNAICTCWVIGQNSTPVNTFAVKGSQSILPNAWDATFVVQPSRVTGSNSVAPQISGAAPPGSSLWFLSPACETTDTQGTLYGAITCAQIGLVSAGLAHGNIQSDWLIQTVQGGLFMFGGGLFYPGGCSYLFQPGCGLVDKGPGTINFTQYYANNVVGVTCAGAPTGAFAVTNGIVTHC